ncbi:hypothetical protein PoB_004836600 [Plakobranchus ocellatus]|uniref:Secreted protein n=1 Tax=Plakobranchus ocellatus TaxID=259542 RepID=A0AAV4BN29_9GAST|nr:hypothetical protein PoB_004836600 [Plakobranchus ocellatus]
MKQCYFSFCFVTHFFRQRRKEEKQGEAGQTPSGTSTAMLVMIEAGWLTIKMSVSMTCEGRARRNDDDDDDDDDDDVDILE